AALAAGDRRTLAELVPDAALRARLPRGLTPEPACDSQNPDTPSVAIVAAGVATPSGGHAPWSLWWGRTPSGWRLTRAAPALAGPLIMADIADRYDPGRAESHWYRAWEERGLFHADAASSKKPYCIVIPPPNVTGSLHWGHALNNTLQD